MLAEMTERLLRMRTFEQAVHTILDDVIAFHGAQYGNIQLPVDDHLIIAAQRGFAAEFLERFKQVKMADGCACGRALRTRQSIVIADVETDADFAMYRDDARKAGFRSVQSTPLISDSGKFLGIVSTHFTEPDKPQKNKIDVFAQYGTFAAERAYELLGKAAVAAKATQMSNEMYSALRFQPHGLHASGTTLAERAFLRMEAFVHDREQYRKFAKECDRLAAIAKTDQQRKDLREIGQAWSKLAQEADTTN